MKFCAVIPLYNHGDPALNVTRELEKVDLPVIIVDDGSDQETKEKIQEILTLFPRTHLVTLPQNQGKGGAVMSGLREAYSLGYSHALQVDADGQHDLSQLSDLLASSRDQPDYLIAGKPIFDETIPNYRKFWRRVTNTLAKIETLSGEIEDAMCGLRIYPLAETLRVLDKFKFGKRMDFDIEVFIKLHWEGVRMLFVPTKVVYPEGGVSHFRLFHDNVEITLMHIKLILGMLLRSGKLLKRESQRRRGR